MIKQKAKDRLTTLSEHFDILGEIVLPVLLKRYKECDAKGHKKPVPAENRCDYCYRRLEQNTLGLLPPGVNYGGINLDNQDEPTLKVLEYIRGLASLGKELEDSGELEAILGGMKK